MPRFLAPLLGIMGSLAVAVPPPTYGQANDLFRWSDRDVTYRFVGRANWRDVRAARDGFARWAVVTDEEGDTLIRLRETSGPADITVRFRPQSSFGNKYRVGLTKTSFRMPSRRLVEAEIELTSLGSKRYYGVDDAIDTAAHEMGHALGISTHSDDPRDLMSAVNGTCLSVRDAATLKRAYGVR